MCFVQSSATSSASASEEGSGSNLSDRESSQDDLAPLKTSVPDPVSSAAGPAVAGAGPDATDTGSLFGGASKSAPPRTSNPVPALAGSGAATRSLSDDR